VVQYLLGRPKGWPGKRDTGGFFFVVWVWLAMLIFLQLSMNLFFYNLFFIFIFLFLARLAVYLAGCLSFFTTSFF
jgi:hypothetical protein